MIIAFGTDDGENLNDDHVGMAKYFYVYDFSAVKEELIERRESVRKIGTAGLLKNLPTLSF